MVGDGAFSHKIGWVKKFLEILNLKGLYWFKSYSNFAEWLGFAYWWSFIKKGLRLQPAQQACFDKK